MSFTILYDVQYNIFKTLEQDSEDSLSWEVI